MSGIICINSEYDFKNVFHFDMILEMRTVFDLKKSIKLGTCETGMGIALYSLKKFWIV